MLDHAPPSYPSKEESVELKRTIPVVVRPSLLVVVPTGRVSAPVSAEVLEMVLFKSDSVPARVERVPLAEGNVYAAFAD